MSVELVQGSLEDPQSIRSAIAGIDLLFHAAAPYPSRHFGMNGMIERAASDMDRLLDICREETHKELLAYPIRRSEQAAIEQAERAAQRKDFETAITAYREALAQEILVGGAPAIRFRLPEAIIQYDDYLRGAMEIDPETLSDFVLLR